MQKNKKKAYHLPNSASSTPPVQHYQPPPKTSRVLKRRGGEETASKANMSWNIPKTQTKTPGSVATQESEKKNRHTLLSRSGCYQLVG